MRSKTLALLILGLIVPAVCSAQSIKPGKWTGTVVPPDGPEVAVTYDVTMAGDTLGIVIHAGEHGDFPVTNASLAENMLKFTFTPGPEIHCALTLNAEGAYAGTCMQMEDESVAQMTMVPPKE